MTIGFLWHKTRTTSFLHNCCTSFMAITTLTERPKACLHSNFWWASIVCTYIWHRHTTERCKLHRTPHLQYSFRLGRDKLPLQPEPPIHGQSHAALPRHSQARPPVELERVGRGQYAAPERYRRGEHGGAEQQRQLAKRERPCPETCASFAAAGARAHTSSTPRFHRATRPEPIAAVGARRCWLHPPCVLRATQ